MHAAASHSFKHTLATQQIQTRDTLGPVLREASHLGQAHNCKLHAALLAAREGH